MSTTTELGTPKSEKCRINSFLSKWTPNEHPETEVSPSKTPKIQKKKNENFQISVDVAEIAVVLQAIGFKIIHLHAGLVQNQNDQMSVSIYCGKSGAKAILERSGHECNCHVSKLPENDENCNNNEKARPLLPKPPEKVLQLTREVLGYVFSKSEAWKIGEEEDMPGRVELCGTPIRGIRPVTRGDTWEVDPKTSPPTITSSPLPKNEKMTPDNQQILVEALNQAKAYIDKALSKLPTKNDTFTKKNVKRVSNIPKTPSTPMTPSTPTTPKSASVTRNINTVRRVCTPRKPSSAPFSPKASIANSSSVPKITPKLDKRPLIPSRIGSIKRTFKTPDNQTYTRTDTPRPGLMASKNLQVKVVSKGLGNPSPLKDPSMGKPKSGISGLSKIPGFAYKKLTGTSK